MSGPADPFRSHLIRPSQVRLWLHDSAVKFVTLHQTTEVNAQAILDEGVIIERTSLSTAWGRGFYTATRPDRQYGNVSVPVAIRLLHPFVADDPFAGQEQIDLLLAQARSEDVHAVLRAAGYDGVVVHFGPDDIWVVAYSDDQVKIVRERGRG